MNLMNRLGVILLALFIAWADSAGIRIIPGNTSDPVQPFVRQVPADQAPASDTSRNWSGYAATDGTYTAVNGTWTVPVIKNPGGSGYGADAAWVGIGGIGSRDLIQAGTQSTADVDGSVTYQTFYETLPDSLTPMSVSVSPGDSVSVSIREVSDGNWRVAIHNNSTGRNETHDIAYDSSHSSAEWIEEAPTVGRRIVPLADFGQIRFTNTTAVRDNREVTLGQANARAITLGSRFGPVLASASQIGDDGASFSVIRQNNDTAQTSAPMLSRRRFFRFPGRFRRVFDFFND